MTLKVRIQVPKNGGPYEAKVMVGTTEHILEPGDEIEAYVYDTQELHVSELPLGSAAAKRLKAA